MSGARKYRKYIGKSTYALISRGYVFQCWASLIAQLVKNPPVKQETLVGKIRCRRDRLPTPVFVGFPRGSAGKEPACNVGDRGSIPGSGRSPGERKGYPLQCSSLENSVDCTVCGVTKSWTRLSNFHFHLHAFQWGFPGGFDGEESVCGEGNGNPLQYSCLENPVDRGAWWAAVRVVRVEHH